MQRESNHGLTMAVVSEQEAVTTDWARHRDEIDIVQVVEPTDRAVPALAAAGFVVKPDHLVWIAPAGGSEEEFFSRLSQNSRYLFRKSLRRTEADGVQISVRHPLTPESLDSFLDVYTSRIGEMHNGLMLAPLERDDFLARGDEYLTVSALRDGSVVGGCICHYSAADDLLRLRYAAVAPGHHGDSLTRSIYATVFRVARELDCRTISLGIDFNLYGHVVRTGLFRFKTQLGFTPIPRQQFSGAIGRDVAERVLRLDNLSDPSLILGYAMSGPNGTIDRTRLKGEAVSSTPELDLRPFEADFLAGLSVTVVSPDAETPELTFPS
ncbi:GNAT family N-acetyltransferase [Streptomyces sp. NPDC001514]